MEDCQFGKNSNPEPSEYVFKNILSDEKSVKLCFLVSLDIIMSYIFSENFIEIH